MGLILDTSTLVTAERRGHSVPEILDQLLRAFGESDVGISAVRIVELTYGIERAKLKSQRQRRQMFVQELRAVMIVHPLTDEIAARAGLIAGQAANRASAFLSPICSSARPPCTLGSTLSPKTRVTSK